MQSSAVACDLEILLILQKSSHSVRKILYCFSVPCRKDAVMTSCAAADTPVLFNCFRIRGTLISVVKRVGDGFEWGCWEGSAGPFLVLVLLHWLLNYHFHSLRVPRLWWPVW